MSKDAEILRAALARAYDCPAVDTVGDAKRAAEPVLRIVAQHDLKAATESVWADVERLRSANASLTSRLEAAEKERDFALAAEHNARVLMGAAVEDRDAATAEAERLTRALEKIGMRLIASRALTAAPPAPEPSLSQPIVAAPMPEYREVILQEMTGISQEWEREYYGEASPAPSKEDTP